MYVQKSKIRKIGNSQGIIFPTEMIELLKLKSGSVVELIIDNGTIIITPQVPSLEQLLATVPKGKKFKEVRTGRARGKEV